MWSLTFMVDGKKHVERIPTEWVEQVRRRVEQGRAFKKVWSDASRTEAKIRAEPTTVERGRKKIALGCTTFTTTRKI